MLRVLRMLRVLHVLAMSRLRLTLTLTALAALAAGRLRPRWPDRRPAAADRDHRRGPRADRPRADPLARPTLVQARGRRPRPSTTAAVPVPRTSASTAPGYFASTAGS
jgi:hypothetical protein